MVFEAITTNTDSTTGKRLTQIKDSKDDWKFKKKKLIGENIFLIFY